MKLVDESKMFLFCHPGSQQHPDSVPEVGEDAVMSEGASSPPPTMTEEERQELQEELVKVRRDKEIEVMVQGVRIRWWTWPVVKESCK